MSKISHKYLEMNCYAGNQKIMNNIEQVLMPFNTNADVVFYYFQFIIIIFHNE